MKCIDCDNERNIWRGDRGLRTRCRLCWNKYCNKKRVGHLDYYAKYLNNYTKSKRKNDDYRTKNNEINNKSNKKAIKELRDSYIKNRIMDGKSWDNSFQEFIDIKKTILQIKRHGRATNNK